MASSGEKGRLLSVVKKGAFEPKNRPAGGVMQRIMRQQEVEELFSADLALLYKHSPT